ncbi:hypothetical protein [Corynebacterium casei]|uniref:hypothetical protein n=1 Tax=Corynebacterium casei TaxID=160386 RepID=UPI003FCF22EC
MNNKSFDNDRHNFQWALQSAQDIMNQSMAPQISAIQATYSEHLQEANSELMRKMFPLYNPSTLGIGRFGQLQAVAGMNADYWADIREKLASSVSLSSTVQSLLDIGAASTVNSQAVGMLDRVNQQYAKNLVLNVQHLVPTNTVPPVLKTMAYDALSGVNRSIGASSVAYALGVLPDRSLSPLMAQISSALKADAFAIGVGKSFASQFDMPESIIQKLGRTLDFYKPGSLSMAMKAAISDPEIAEAVEELIDGHPEEVQELTSRVSRDYFGDLFPGTVGSNMKLAGPWIGAFGTISGSAFTGVTGPALAYIVLLAILGLLVSTGGELLEQKEDSRKQSDSPEGK